MSVSVPATYFSLGMGQAEFPDIRPSPFLGLGESENPIFSSLLNAIECSFSIRALSNRAG